MKPVKVEDLPQIEKPAGFKKQYGYDPVPGVNYDPNNICQDDYEYLTGTGQYSNE